eukprot:g2826.t1
MNKLRRMTQDKSLTELDVSGIGFGAEGAAVVAKYIKTNGALTSLDISANNIGQLVADPELMKQHGVIYDLCTGGPNKGSMLYWDKDDNDLGKECPAHCRKPMGAIAIANAISTNGALTSLDISYSGLCRGKLKDYPGQYTLANVGLRPEAEWGNNDHDYESDMAGVVALADAIKNNGASVCADGKHYHEWQLNPLYGVQSLDGRWESDEPSELTIKNNQVTFNYGIVSSLVVADGNVKLGEWIAVQDMQKLCFKMAGKKDITWTKQQELKFTSTSPDVAAQNEDVPLVAGICQHCGQPKDQHRTKGALAILDIRHNNIPGTQHTALKRICKRTNVNLKHDLRG